MEELKELYYFGLILIPAGVAGRIVYCAVAASHAEDAATYKRKGKNALIFLVFAMCIYSMFGIFVGYFGGSLTF